MHTTIEAPHSITIGHFGTMADIRRAHSGHWFDKDTMRFFRTTLPDGEYGVWHGRYFISGERDPFGGDRRYTIRYCTDDGHIATLGDFQQYPTAEAARKVLRSFIS